jgi:RNA polymerase sigma factor (TIGR02999 family)
MLEPPARLTQILADVNRGDQTATERLWNLVYEELHVIARRNMAQEHAARTLQPTALVHEAYLRLLGSESPDWDSRGHFFAAAANAMRRILIDRARRRDRLRHGGALRRTPLSEVVVTAEDQMVELLDLDAALTKLEAIDASKATIVTMRYLIGCTVEETAQALGQSPAKIKKDWTFARAWLHRELSDLA